MTGVNVSDGLERILYLLSILLEIRIYNRKKQRNLLFWQRASQQPL